MTVTAAKEPAFMTSNGMSEQAQRARAAVLGTGHAKQEIEGTDYARILADWSASSVWEVWGRPGLDIKYRSAATVAVLVTAGRLDLLRFHLQGALRLGFSVEELAELILQIGIYAGTPAASDAMSVLVRTHTEWVAERAAEAGYHPASLSPAGPATRPCPGFIFARKVSS
jgi:alkylhydroperoxidase/carboxymuconolactone decarboxylase family protein YurZ